MILCTVVRVAQLLINDAESAIAEANPATPNDETRDRTGTVNPQFTDASSKETLYQMRTAAGVWGVRRPEDVAD